MPEIWKPVVGYEGRYEVSDLGRVKTLRRFAGTRWYAEKVLTGSPFVGKRYIRVTLYSDGEPETRRVHQLVLEAFVGPCPPGMECLHADDTPENNSLTNLSWDTKKKNQAARVQAGTSPRGTGNGRAKLSDDEVVEIRSSLLGAAELAAKYAVSKTHIRRLIAHDVRPVLC